MNLFEILTDAEITFFHCLEMVEEGSLWGVAIKNVVENPDPVRYRMLVSELKSQADDSPEIMTRILGDRCYQNLINL